MPKQKRREKKNSLLKQQKIPTILVKLNSLNGKKFNGIKISEHTIFHRFTDKNPGNSKSSESANKTISATHAASSSSVNRMLVAIRAFLPNEINARSENVIKLGSRSMHLASSLAVYAVTVAARNNVTIPQSQPAYLKPIGKLRRPTPMRTLDDKQG